MRFWLRWAVGVAAMIGIVVIWAFDSGSCASVADGPDGSPDACNAGMTGGLSSVVLTLLLVAAAMWAILSTKRDAER